MGTEHREGHTTEEIRALKKVLGKTRWYKTKTRTSEKKPRQEGGEGNRKGFWGRKDEKEGNGTQETKDPAVVLSLHISTQGLIGIGNMGACSVSNLYLLHSSSTRVTWTGQGQANGGGGWLTRLIKFNKK